MQFVEWRTIQGIIVKNQSPVYSLMQLCYFSVCDSGWYLDSSGLCEKCEIGTYKEDVGNGTECTPCGSDNTTAAEGAVSRNDCGMYTPKDLDF